MGIIFERKINYYETDRMGVVHHSNYIRFLEVLGVNCSYKYHVTFGDTILINVFAKEYTGVRMTVGYEVRDKKTDKIVLLGETKHCFTDRNLKPVNLKKYAPDFSKKIENLLNT